MFKFSSFQVPFNEVHYDLIGDDLAPTFFQLNEASGDVAISRDLQLTDATNFTASHPSLLQLLWSSIVYGLVR